MKNRKLKNSELNRITNTEFKSSKKTPLIVILDNIRSLNNIGSVFRTSDAFLIEKIYLCGITAKPPHKDIHDTKIKKTALISRLFNVNIFLFFLEIALYKAVGVNRFYITAFLK